MIAGPLRFPVRRVLGAMVNSSLSRYGALPLPQDTPVLHAAGPDPDRVLLIGTGTVRGLGVTSNELGLGGQLARRLAALTGRGADVELASAVNLTVGQAPELLDAYDTGRFDAIILMLGMRDVIRVTSVRDWRLGMRRLLEVASRVPRVFVIAVPDFAAYLEVPAAAARLMRRHGDRLNEATREITSEFPGVEFVPFSPRPPTHFVAPGSIEIYEHFADAMVGPIALGLDPLLRALRPGDPIPENARQKALDALGVVGSGRDKRVDRIARMARDLLGASGASVTFLDHNRQWVKSAVSVSADDMARADAFCNTTISKPRLFVVEDAANDADFAQHPWVVGEERVRFYAGYPLEAPEGVRVGALCVVDTKPRQFSGEEAALLRELALRVQDVLWSRAGRPGSES